MKTEIRKAMVPDELRSLSAFDRKVFPSDYFPPSAWKSYQSYWLLIADRKIGCCAFEEHIDFQEDVRPDGVNPHRAGSLYIATTGILPAFQNQGLGELLKAWQIAYGRRYGFTRIVTNTRKSNAAMIALNKKYKFRILRITRGYYSAPVEATVVMELVL